MYRGTNYLVQSWSAVLMAVADGTIGSPDPIVMTEDEWRESRFSEEEITSSKHVDAALGKRSQPTFSELKEAAEQYGPEGILESALHLPRDQFEKLEKIVKKSSPPKSVKRRKKR